MFGFLFGFACLIALIVVLRKEMHAKWGGSCGGHRGWHGHGSCGPDGGHGGGFWAHRDMFLRRMFGWLGTSPNQEKAIKETMNKMQEAVSAAKRDLWLTREQLAVLFRSDSFDETLVSDMISRHDEAVERVRNAAVDSLAKVYEILDPDQRAKLAEWLEQGKGGFGGHPYRTAAKV